MDGSLPNTDISRSRVIRFPDLLRVRVSAAITEALDVAAEQHHTSCSEYIRGAVISRLRADGVPLKGAAR